MIITTDLYHRILEKNLTDYKKIRIVSGYGSASFLRKILSNYSNIELDIYIGMAQQGISKLNHKGYLEIMSEYKKVNVFYQVNGDLNHMKLIEFYNSATKKAYIGSANFTENGYVRQKECMSLLNANLDEIFKQQQKNSLVCTSEGIDKYISFFDDQLNDSEQVEGFMIPEKKKFVNKNTTSNSFEVFQMKSKKELMIQSDMEFFNYFKIPIVLPKERDPHWQSKGINSWTKNVEPRLKETPKLTFESLYPKDELFEIELENGYVFEACLTGKFNRELKILNGNIFEIIRQRLNLLKETPISYEMLKERGVTEVSFVRLNEKKYYMYFENDEIN